MYPCWGELFAAIRWAWCRETAKGEWDEDNPSLNQCAVTALVVQDYWGGELMRCEMSNGDSRYWNRLPTGQQIDMTANQYRQIKAQTKWETTIFRDRDYVLSFPDTRSRYELLAARVRDWLHQNQREQTLRNQDSHRIDPVDYEPSEILDVNWDAVEAVEGRFYGHE